MMLFLETVAVVSSVFVRVMNVQDVPCSLSGQLVQCVVGNPLKGRTGSTSKILLDATHLSATRDPLYIAVNVTTLVLACFCVLYYVYVQFHCIICRSSDVVYEPVTDV